MRIAFVETGKFIRILPYLAANYLCLKLVNQEVSLAEGGANIATLVKAIFVILWILGVVGSTIQSILMVDELSTLVMVLLKRKKLSTWYDLSLIDLCTETESPIEKMVIPSFASEQQWECYLKLRKHKVID